ncbi:mannose/fructose/sorbose PTS transporter subunit IIA [Clostridium uliginosum]|uniref:PTS system, mannose-specific IIA component/PTS system, mannose-specific IIB component n=1 Tax=Clostridium uliginosum TaxID=119641 RepID=A0A1I1P9T8_9CLOT|nr:mannose/fructose/sorbose PTS transporter subunit IIA [Clostridium uliginosum]SFD06495.1 PTS system, mannose-specific IIA component/PTS system, mannose-specific IIB component [Clostridium uliginosum]
MIAIIVGTHGMFSEELIKSSEMIFGIQENIGYVTFKPGEGTDDLVNKYNTLLGELDCTDGVLFMVDLFGGSPFNAASMIAMKNNNIEIISGVNLPMLLETFGSRSFSTLSELVKVAENSGKDSIRPLIKMIAKSEEDEL